MTITPSQEQKNIISSQSKHILVEANAGAAKTTTAAMRIGELINRGIDPSKIVALSFSKAGVHAYRAAFQRIGMQWEQHSKIRMGTVDEFCESRLKRLDASSVRAFTHARDVKPFVLDAIHKARDVANAKHPGEFGIQGNGALSVEFLLESFAVLKGSLGIQRFSEHFRCTPNVANELGTDYTTLAVLLAYEKGRLSYDPQNGAATQFRFTGDHTYDLALQLLSEDPPWNHDNNPLALNLQAIVVDEMHDISWAIFTVLRHLLDNNRQASFLGVGDRDQVIHGKHGADSYFMGPNLDNELGPVQRYPLSKTHRFGDNLAQAMGLFSHKPYQSAQSVLTTIRVKPAVDARQNANHIAELIHRYEQEKSDDISNIAVLIRHPGTSAGIEHALFSNSTPYTTVGFTPFLQRPEVAFIRMLLSIALDHETTFTQSSLITAKHAVWEFLGSNLPEHLTPEGTRLIIDEATEDNFKTYVFPELLKDATKEVSRGIFAAMTLAEADDPLKIIEVAKALRLDKLLETVFVSKAEIQEALLSIESLAEVAKQYSSLNALLKALNSIDIQQWKNQTKTHRLTLSTIEEAKGLEFSHVIILDCNAQAFDGADQEERNLFYVATTRAREFLLITFNPQTPSSYLKYFM